MENIGPLTLQPSGKLVPMLDHAVVRVGGFRCFKRVWVGPLSWTLWFGVSLVRDKSAYIEVYMHHILISVFGTTCGPHHRRFKRWV